MISRIRLFGDFQCSDLYFKCRLSFAPEKIYVTGGGIFWQVKLEFSDVSHLQEPEAITEFI